MNRLWRRVVWCAGGSASGRSGNSGARQGWGSLNEQMVLLWMAGDEGWLDCTIVNPVEDPRACECCTVQEELTCRFCLCSMAL